MIVAYFVRRKKPEAQAGTTQKITQTQEFNPHLEFNPTIQIGIPDARPAVSEQEKLRLEQLVLDFMKEQNQKRTPAPAQRSLIYHVEGIPSETDLNMQQAKEALESLYLKTLIYRSTVDDGRHFIYWLNSD